MRQMQERRWRDMATKAQNFIQMFQYTYQDSQGTSHALDRIVIPMIQRDYAQGREDARTREVRKRFLDALHEAVTGKPITLDFIYGDISPDGIMTPLDGQQRLTTLFLLHWYAAKRAGVPESEYAFLKNFSYETRASARMFCEKLIDPELFNEAYPRMNLPLSASRLHKCHFLNGVSHICVKKWADGLRR